MQSYVVKNERSATVSDMLVGVPQIIQLVLVTEIKVVAAFIRRLSLILTPLIASLVILHIPH